MSFTEKLDKLTHMDNYKIKDIAGLKEFEPVSFIKRGTTLTRSILAYAKMKKKAIGPQSITKMFPSRCRKPSDARDIMKTLEGRGMLRRVEADTWQITPYGENALHLLGRRDAENTGGNGLNA